MADEALRAQYDAILEMAEQARRRCVAPSGEIALYVNEPGPDGQRHRVRNPYLPEYHRLMNQARHMARDLGITEPVAEPSELLRATEGGDRVQMLQALLRKLAVEIDNCEGHGMAALSREYLEAQKALEEAMADEPGSGGVDAIVARKANPNQKRFSIVR